MSPDPSHEIIKSLETADLQALYQRTGGLPLCLQLINLLCDLDIPLQESMTYLDTLPNSERVAGLASKWRRQLSLQNNQFDKRTDDILLILANVPLLGAEPRAIAECLELSEPDIGSQLYRLLSLGFISRISTGDAAIRCHDTIRAAYSPKAEDLPALLVAKKRYRKYCERVTDKTSIHSLISIMDSACRASEAFFERAEENDFEDMGGVQAKLAFAHLNELQKVIGIATYRSAAEIRKFTAWLTKYVAREIATTECYYALPMARMSRLLPIADPDLGEAFTPAWETGAHSDVSVVVETMLASVRHLESDSTLFERIERAINRCNWKSHFGYADILAAGFAAALAMVGKHGVAAAVLSGYRVRGKDICTKAGFSVILLHFDAFHRGTNVSSSFLTHHGHFCRDLDPVVVRYLVARKFPVSCASIGREVEANLNRAATLGSWAGNSLFCKYVSVLSQNGKPSRNAEYLSILNRACFDHAIQVIFFAVRSRIKI